jgi:DNA-binding XRE family transcriptional regulator
MRLPPLPKANINGNYPALEYATAVLARKLIRERCAVGFTQADLARRAGVRPETLNRIERGKAVPSIATVDKIARAIEQAQADTEAKR